MYKRLILMLVMAVLLTGCQLDGLLAPHDPVSAAFGPIDERLELGGGWVVLSPAHEGKRQLSYLIEEDGSYYDAGDRQHIGGSEKATLLVKSGIVVVETVREGAPQYQAYKPGPDGLKPVDYYMIFAPEAPVQRGHSLLVNKRLNALWQYRDGKLVRAYRVSTGRQTEPPAPTWDDYRTNYFTPEGDFTVTNFVTNPPFNALKPGDISYAGGDPANPLGTRWMGFAVLPNDNAWLWGLHGTSHPELIGTWASDGCVRMLTEEAEVLFEQLQGEQVSLRIVSN